MKKIFTVAVMLLAGLTAFAQLNIGVGYQNEMWTTKSDNHKSSTGLNGIYAGVSYNIPLNFVDGLGVAPGAYFTWAAGKKSDAVLGTVSVNDLSILVPVHITFSMDLGAGAAFAYLGPAFQYGLVQKASWTVAGEKFIVNNAYTKEQDTLPFDVKLDLGFGYRYKFIQANVGFDFGFLNRDRDKSVKTHEQLIHAGVAFVF